jgi:hypothetical protein
MRMRIGVAFAFAMMAVFALAQAAPQAPSSSSLDPAALCMRSPEVCDHDFLVHYSDDDKPSKNNDLREDWLKNPIPHPFLYAGPSIMGGGYAVWAYRVEGGIDVESTHFIGRALGAYDDGHKVDDGDQPNPKGHDRYLDTAVYYRLDSGRFQRFYFGGGYTWSQLSTTNYTKGGGRYQLGGGYDVFTRNCEECRRDFSMRVNTDWITAGNDRQNGSHGPEVTLTFPSPIEKRHWFWVEAIGVFGFHQSVTEPTNLPLVQFQTSQKSIDAYGDFGVIYRF